MMQNKQGKVKMNKGYGLRGFLIFSVCVGVGELPARAFDFDMGSLAGEPAVPKYASQAYMDPAAFGMGDLALSSRPSPLLGDETLSPNSQLSGDLENRSVEPELPAVTNDQLSAGAILSDPDSNDGMSGNTGEFIPIEASERDQDLYSERKLTELKLRSNAAPWDLAGLDSPLFGSEEITEFTRQINAEGTWKLRPHFSATALYDDNVFIREKDKQSDLIFALSPGVSLRLGNGQTAFYVTADYTATAVLFQSNSSEDSLDHNANFALQWVGGKLRLGLLLGFSADSGTSIDATDRVRRISFYSGVTSHYDYSEKVSFDLNADYRPISYEDLLGSSEARLQGYINYNFTPKLTIGLGGVLGYVTVEEGSDQTTEEASIRAVYVATGKLTFTANAGLELRQFEGDGGEVTSPVFGLGATWAVREGTTVNLNARRRIFASAIFPEQDYINTGVALSITQRMTDRFDLSLTTSFDQLEYIAAGRGVSATRHDDYFSIRPAIQWHALAWCNVGMFYEYSQNVSSGEGNRSFDRNRVGLQVSVIF